MSTDDRAPDEGSPADTRWWLVATGVPFPFLVAAGLLEILGPGDRAGWWWTSGLVALTAVWLTGMLPLRTRTGAPRVVYFAGLLVLVAGLVAWSPWFALFAWVASAHAFTLFPPRWALFGAAGAGFALVVVQAGSPVPMSRESFPLFFASLVVPLLIGAWSLGRENDARRRLAARLGAANGELQAALAANTALQNQLLAQARTAGADDERQRMAREIHDTLAQDLSAVVSQLEAALHAQNAPGRWVPRVTAARDMAREGLVEARRSVRALGPRQLENTGLSDALDRLAAQWSRREATPAVYTLVGTVVPLGEETESALFRVAQEALANVAQHAGATRVRLTLSYLDDVVLLDIGDDGAGIPAGTAGTQAGERGYGLAGMRQRLREVGGRMEVESTAGAGTVITASVPVPPLACP